MRLASTTFWAGLNAYQWHHETRIPITVLGMWGIKPSQLRKSENETGMAIYLVFSAKPQFPIICGSLVAGASAVNLTSHNVRWWVPEYQYQENPRPIDWHQICLAATNVTHVYVLDR